MTKPLRGDAISKLNKLKSLTIKTSQRIGKLYKIMKQYFFLVTELVNGKLTPLKITLQSYNAIKFGRTYAKKHPDSLISLYKQPISNSGKVTWICHLEPWSSKESESIMTAEEQVQLDILSDNDMLIKING